MRPSFYLLPAFILFINLSYGQDSSLLKRKPYKLTVHVDKKSVYEEDLKETPYVLPNNTIQLYPGETVYIEVEEENGVIKRLTAVKENTNPAKTVVIAFTQTVNGKKHEMMMLKVSNPFSRDLVYDAAIFSPQQNRWASTDVYPVKAGLSGIETWQDVITSIGLGHWAFKSN